MGTGGTIRIILGIFLLILGIVTLIFIIGFLFLILGAVVLASGLQARSRVQLQSQARQQAAYIAAMQAPRPPSPQVGGYYPPSAVPVTRSQSAGYAAPFGQAPIIVHVNQAPAQAPKVLMKCSHCGRIFDMAQGRCDGCGAPAT